MAGNDGTTTELFTGWSSVVHQPEDEPEESELPSTVDIGALSAEPPEPSQKQDEAESDSESEDSEADSSNSDASASQESCSHSDSSDSDSSSSSQESTSRSPSPEFSVTSTQTNGLRLTIATVRKSISSPVNTAKRSLGPNKNQGKKKSDRKSSTSSCSNCSSDSDDSNDSDNKSEAKKQPGGRKAAPAVKGRLVNSATTKSCKEPEKAKQSPVATKNRAPATQMALKEGSIPKLKLSSSGSSIASGTKDQKPLALRDKEAVLNKSRISSSSNLRDAALPKTRSNTKDREPAPKDKERDAGVVGKLRSSAAVNASSKDLQKTRGANSAKISAKEQENPDHTPKAPTGNLKPQNASLNDSNKGSTKDRSAGKDEGTNSSKASRKKVRMKKRAKKPTFVLEANQRNGLPRE
ncbi:hypothetical protein HUJ05_011545 [Dendroctonus ponderosae]|nr:hypothetical protein HUJ05_011545 [Dendroctonus ponderosae]